ncbi:MAG: SRPBCC family protein [Dehalococcoidia bacterium]
MYSFTTSIDINALPARVWRALCDPAEVVQWDIGVEEALDAPAGYPQPGQHVRWRYSNGLFRLLHDRPQEVVQEERLRSTLSVGFVKFDETYRLEARNGSCRLSASMTLWALLPLVGALVERIYLGAQSRRTVEASLRAIKTFCEKEQ